MGNPSEMENAVTEQKSEQQPAPSGGEQAPQQPQGGKEKQPPWGAPENFDAAKAWELIQDLRTEKGGDGAAALREQVEAMKKAGDEQRAALAKALGVAPEETSDTEKLTSQLSSLQKQVLASERRALAAEHQIPEQFQHLLTATDSDGLKEQAQALVEFAKGSAYAAATQAPPPAFQANPAQGQGGGPTTPEAQAAEEYAKYYDEQGRPRF